MSKKYDIGLIGFWYGKNYGSLLNGYAEYLILKRCGKKVLMIQKPGADASDIELQSGHNINFINTFYDKDDISGYYKYSELKDLNDICDTFCAGSDQIWNYSLSFSGNMYLPFVNSQNRRISFSTSFGSSNDHVPQERYEYVRKELLKFDAVSVREQFAVGLLDKKYGIKSTLAFEPVFCIEKADYEEIIKTSNIEVGNDYILAYILNPSDEKIEFLKEISNRTHKEVITIIDGDRITWHSPWNNFKRIDDFPNVKSEIEVSDFLKLFSSADFVITDSFHGTAFSVIFEKKFISISNRNRGTERFKDILGRLGLLDRLIDGSEPLHFEDRFFEEIDYERVYDKIEKEKRQTLEWIKKAVDINICDKSVKKTMEIEKCTGCAACANVCPTSAIKMGTDRYGYYIPEITEEKCINCGACTRVCPTLTIRENTNHPPELYEFQTNEEDTLFASSSGGIFTTLAKKVFEKNGYVCGASWTKEFKVEHIIIDNISDIGKLQKSKYLQSYVSEDLHKNIREKLASGDLIMFTGCPCQVAGLRNFLGKDYDNLVLIDLLCGNAPSADFFRKYLKEDVPENLIKYVFRSKKRGWNSTCVELMFDTGETETRYGRSYDEYQRLYHNHTMCSKHCESCKYQFFPRLGDISIGDFWWIEQHDKEIDTKKGVSAVLVNNEKGRRWFDDIDDSSCIKKAAPIEWLNGNGNYKGNWAGKKRDAFYDAILTKSFHDAADYALKPNHGEYREIYKDTAAFLQYDRISYQFKFNAAWWEQHVINGCLTLMVKPGASKVGRYAVMQLGGELKKDCRYRFSIRYKINTMSDVINFHIKDSGSDIYQLILSQKISGKNIGKDWLEHSVEFVPNANFYDEFMIGASQVSGDHNYISFAYINIVQI